jgi:hypothetical protein
MGADRDAMKLEKCHSLHSEKHFRPYSKKQGCLRMESDWRAWAQKPMRPMVLFSALVQRRRSDWKGG